MRRIGVFAVFALLATGCTGAGGEDSTFTPTSTFTPPSYSSTRMSTPPTSPTTPTTPIATTGPNVRPGEKPPTLPAVGRTNTDGGARAFAEFYIKALDWGYATMDSTLAKSLFAKSCTGCARFVKKIFDNQRGKGRHYVGSRLSPIGVETMPNDHHLGATETVDVIVMQTRGQLVDRRGRLVESEPAVPRATFRGWLAWRAGEWAMLDWKLEVEK